MIGPSNFRLPLLALALVTTSSVAYAQGTPIALRDSFPIGSGDGTLCQVQDRSLENKAKKSIFDRSWAVVCRDSARPVGYVYAFRSPKDDIIARIGEFRADPISCNNPAQQESINGINRNICKLTDEPVSYSIYQQKRGNVSYVAEGLTVYDSATLLALESIVADKISKVKSM